MFLGQSHLRYFAILLAILACVPVATAHAETETAIPNLIKQVAGFWSNDLISDSEFLDVIKFLLQNEFIVLSESDAGESSSMTGTAGQPAVPSTVVEIVPIRTSIQDVLVAQTREDEVVSPGFESRFAINYIWILENLYELDDKKKLDSINSFLELMFEDFRLSDTYKEKVDKIKSFLRADKDFKNFMKDTSYDELIRYNDRYVDEEMFLVGTVKEVSDLGEGRYGVLMSIEEINFNDDAGAAVIEYTGPRIRDSDNILVLGTITGLEVREIDDAGIITRMKSGGMMGVDNDYVAGDKVQIETPTIAVSHIQVLTVPYLMVPAELEEATLKIAYNDHKDNETILIGSIIYYQGTITSISKDTDGVKSKFRLDVNPGISQIDIVTVLKDDNTISVSRHDRIGIYGLIIHEVDDLPTIHALHITN